MAICETTDFTYPLLADIYYPIVETGAYGNSKKTWVLDRTIACFFNPAGRKTKQDVNSENKLELDNLVIGRVKNDLTQSTNDSYSITNIIIANIRDKSGNIIYNESAGVRKGNSTIFEIASLNPIVGAFGKTEYYKVLIRRSENQAADL
jgi:hypothetical protein